MKKDKRIIGRKEIISIIDLDFFVIFQIVDFYFEDGFIGMISQWFVYWVFAIIAWLVTNNINFYKNFQFYKYESMSNKKL